MARGATRIGQSVLADGLRGPTSPSGTIPIPVERQAPTSAAASRDRLGRTSARPSSGSAAAGCEPPARRSMLDSLGRAAVAPAGDASVQSWRGSCAEHLDVAVADHGAARAGRRTPAPRAARPAATSSASPSASTATASPRRASTPRAAARARRPRARSSSSSRARRSSTPRASAPDESPTRSAGSAPAQAPRRRRSPPTRSTARSAPPRATAPCASAPSRGARWSR